MPDRNGKRKTREQLLKKRIPELGYYFIVTDTKETEQNYMLGLRNSIPPELQGRLVIRVVKTKTIDLVTEALNMASLQPQYGQVWIVFDRDQVKGFDDIIMQAAAKGINVGWSNPCIEIWFNAYWGSMPWYKDSVSCCEGFAHRFEQITGQKYEKSDKTIYQKLIQYGNQKQAIRIAKKRIEEHNRNYKCKPSDMCPATTVHLLVEEISQKIESKHNSE